MHIEFSGVFEYSPVYAICIRRVTPDLILDSSATLCVQRFNSTIKIRERMIILSFHHHHSVSQNYLVLTSLLTQAPD